jgi:replication factor A1
MEMGKEKIAPHVDDIFRALGEKIERKTIEAELENYVNTYRVGLEVAKRSIVKKHGGKISSLSLGANKTLSELVSNEQSVEVVVRLITVNAKEIEVQGATKQIYYGLASDNTRTLPYTAWETEAFAFQKGDVIRAINAYTGIKEWNGKPQLNFGTRTKFYKEDPGKLPEAPAGEATAAQFPPRKAQVKDIAPGVRNIQLTARILSVAKREVTVNGQQKTVFSGVLVDSTGQAYFSAWDDFNLEEDECVSISGGYVSAWRGIPQLNFDSGGSRVEKITDGSFPKKREITHTPPVQISAIAGKGGALSTAVRGIVVDIRPGSGLVFRCPECKRVTNKGECKLHGRVDAVSDLRTKAVIDDGTGTVMVILNRELTEKVLGKPLEACMKEAKDRMNPDIVHIDLAEKLVATPMQARGDMTSDEFGLTMIATGVEEVKIDVNGEAQAMLSELESEGGGI